MAILLVVSRILSRNKLAFDAVILLFQPAGEDGSGARSVVSGPAMSSLCPDHSFALHNMFGRPFGEVDIIDGLFFCESRCLKVTLTGKTAHALQPETGISPMQAISVLMPQMTAFGSALGNSLSDPKFRQLTITHANMVAPVFGVAPGQADVLAILRALMDEAMHGSAPFVLLLPDRIKLMFAVEYLS